MSYNINTRNFDKVQYEGLRKKVDFKFNNAHDELSALYYDEWKQGNFTHDFKGYKPKDEEEAKELFDKLHGLIFKLRDVALNEENERQVVKDEKLYKEFHEKKEKNGVLEEKTPFEKIQESIINLKNEGIELTI